MCIAVAVCSISVAPTSRPARQAVRSACTAAALARKAGADIKQIQKMLRHSSHAITADTYTSIFEDDDRAVAEAMSTVVPRRAVVGEASETDGPTVAWFR